MNNACTMFFVGALAAGSANQAKSANLSELAAGTKPSVVHLTILGSSGSALGTGTGFFISTGGLIVTNYHVIASANQVQATLADGTQRAIQGLLAVDKDRDIALIRAEGDGFPLLRLGDSSTLKQGDGVVVVGSPRGLSGTLSEGIVSAIRQNETSPQGRGLPSGRIIQITAAISPGSSGSPVLNMDGEVIGVAAALHSGGQNLNFAVPVEAVSELVATLQEDTPLRPFAAFPWHNLLISFVFFATVGAVVAFTRKRRGRVPPSRLSVN